MEKSINQLIKQDIKTIIKDIKDNNLKVVYWETGKDVNETEELWFINDEHIYDYLHFRTDVKLHWTVLTEELIKAIKQEINYEIE